MVLFKKIFLSMVLFMCFVTAYATIRKDLYTANIPLAPGLSSFALTQQAWQRVLPRLTGRSLEQLPAVLVTQPASSLQRLIERFQYQTIKGEREYHVAFAETRVNALLLKQHVPLWAATRPRTLLWVMSVPTDAPVELLTIDNPQIQAVSVFAHQRAYPLMLPLGDLSDEEPLERMSAALSSAALQSLAKRYHVHRILVARLRSDAASEWYWWADQHTSQQWQQAYQANLLTALLAGLNTAINTEADSSQQTLERVIKPYELTVLGVASLADSEALLHGLTQQHAVFQWRHHGLSSDAMHVTLLSSHSVLVLRRALRHVKKLTFLAKGENSLVYVWGDASPSQWTNWKHQYASEFSVIPKSEVLSQQNSKPLLPESSDEGVTSFKYHSEAGYRGSSPKKAEAPTVSSIPLVAGIAPLVVAEAPEPPVASSDSLQWQIHPGSQENFEGDNNE